MLVVATFALNAACNFALGLVVARLLGPAEFGRYALAFTVGVLLNTLFLDWLRLAATRFYSAEAREERPRVRASLDLAYALSGLALGVVALGFALAGEGFGLPLALALMAPLVGLAQGLFDYHAALLRARFEDRAYARLAVAKNLLALALMAGGALVGGAALALAGLCVSVATSLLLVRGALRDPASRPFGWRRPFRAERRASGAAPGAERRRAEGASRAELLRFARYGLPAVAATLMYHAAPLLGRAGVAAQMGFAESGQFSLAYDVAVRAVTVVVGVLDVHLFQLAVAAEARGGVEAARARLALNQGIILAATGAVAGGLWLGLPSLEAMLVPGAFRGPFAAYVEAFLPGLAALALVLYAVNPVFQVRRSTWPAAVAAAAALAVTAGLAAGLPGGADGLGFARAQSAGFVAALVVAAGLARRALPVVPRARDAAGAALGLALMLAAALPLRALPPGAPTLLLTALAAAAALALGLLATDALGARGAARAALARLRGRRRAVAPAE